jgi:tyrosyl-tRNA synthetase
MAVHAKILSSVSAWSRLAQGNGVSAVETLKGNNKSNESNKQRWQSTLPADVVEEAEELGRGSEILPEGLKALAERIHLARKEQRPLRVKLGIDPTSTDLHIGHAVQFRKLRRFQDFGHQVVLIIGGFTARIGDPTGRDETRPVLTEEQVDANAKTYLEQVGVILDMEKVELTNNAVWLGKLSSQDMLRLAGSVTVNQLLAKEAFGSRVEKGLPLGLHEVFYPLLQGYDSVAIKSDVELGGTDQRFNILMGRELQPLYGIKTQQLAMLSPLLEGTDGEKKMSKTYNNYVGLKELPTDMFGKVMRIPDGLIMKYYEWATTHSGTEIDKIGNAIKSGANPMQYKEQLAQQIVSQYHGAEAGLRALDEWKRVHSERQAPEDMESFVLSEPTAVFRILVNAKLAESGGAAKRLVLEGGVRLDGEVMRDPNAIVEVIKGQNAVLQVGRRKWLKLVSS